MHVAIKYHIKSKTKKKRTNYFQYGLSKHLAFNDRSVLYMGSVNVCILSYR